MTIPGNSLTVGEEFPGEVSSLTLKLKSTNTPDALLLKVVGSVPIKTRTPPVAQHQELCHRMLKFDPSDN
jgi:hypothetical protein